MPNPTRVNYVSLQGLRISLRLEIYQSNNNTKRQVQHKDTTNVENTVYGVPITKATTQDTI